MDLTRTISVVEIVWTAGCLPGLIFNTRLLNRAVGDLAVVRVNKINSIREYAAITTLVLFGYLALMQFAFVMIGALAMLSPAAGGAASTTKFVTTAVFLTISWLSSVTGYVVNKRRVYLRDLIAAMEFEDDPAKLREVLHGKRPDS